MVTVCHISNGQSNRVNMFGPRMAEVVAAIDAAKWRRAKPIGPIGYSSRTTIPPTAPISPLPPSLPLPPSRTHTLHLVYLRSLSLCHSLRPLPCPGQGPCWPQPCPAVLANPRHVPDAARPAMGGCRGEVPGKCDDVVLGRLPRGRHIPPRPVASRDEDPCRSGPSLPHNLPQAFYNCGLSCFLLSLPDFSSDQSLPTSHACADVSPSSA